MPQPANAAAVNADQIDYWNGEAGARWAELEARVDGLFRGITAAAFDHARPLTGEAVIDVGCGCGGTTLLLAEKVGCSGRVLGIDISEPMLAQARARAHQAGLDQISFEHADASTQPLPQASFDLLFSRFGVMFFRNPVDAFTNLRRAIKAEGRLLFACWRTIKENPWFLVPLAATRDFVPPLEPAGPEDPGPFAFADPERVRRILTAAGFRDVALEPVDLPIRLADAGGTERAARLATEIGPTARALENAAPETLAAARAAITRAFEPYDGPGGVQLGAGIWLVSARP